MQKKLSMLVTIILIGVLTLPVTAKASNEDDIVAEINAYRESAGLELVALDEDLSDVAAIRAVECSEKFSHTRPNGQAWNTVSSLTNGENLAHAKNYNQQKPENVVYAWMLSPKHCANVLRKSFSTVGIAYYVAENGDTYIACEFR